MSVQEAVSAEEVRRQGLSIKARCAKKLCKHLFGVSRVPFEQKGWLCDYIATAEPVQY